MEQIIQFIEVYWGFTIVGSLTVGTLITFIVMQIRFNLSAKNQNSVIGTLLGTIEAGIKSKDAESYDKAKLMAENYYLQNTIALTFKYLNYITIESKMSVDKKIELVEDAKQLKVEYADKLVEIADGIFQDIDTVTVENLLEEGSPIMEVVEDVIEDVSSLLDKYSQEG